MQVLPRERLRGRPNRQQKYVCIACGGILKNRHHCSFVICITELVNSRLPSGRPLPAKLMWLRCAIRLHSWARVSARTPWTQVKGSSLQNLPSSFNLGALFASASAWMLILGYLERVQISNQYFALIVRPPRKLASTVSWLLCRNHCRWIMYIPDLVHCVLHLARVVTFKLADLRCAIRLHVYVVALYVWKRNRNLTWRQQPSLLNPVALCASASAWMLYAAWKSYRIWYLFRFPS